MSTRYIAARLMRTVLCGILVAAAVAMTAAQASAHGRGHVFFGFNAWAPSYYYPPPYYYPPYYYPPAYYFIAAIPNDAAPLGRRFELGYQAIGQLQLFHGGSPRVSPMSESQCASNAQVCARISGSCNEFP